MYGKQEYKYLVPNTLLDAVRSDMMPFLKRDPYTEENGEYLVRSIYYDTPRLNCYVEKIEGLKVRRKYRVRGYNSGSKNGLVFLEIKRKYGSYISKNRSPLKKNNLENIFSDPDIERNILSLSNNGIEKEDAQRFFYHYYRHGLRPIILVVYDREAYLSKFASTLRITLDKNLRSVASPSLNQLWTNEGMRYAMSRYFIMEVKFHTGLPDWLRAMITKYRLPRMALSKYTICIDSYKKSAASASRTAFSRFHA